MSSGPPTPNAPPASPTSMVEPTTQPLTLTQSAPPARSPDGPSLNVPEATPSASSASAPAISTPQPDSAAAATPAAPPSPSVQAPQPATKDHIEPAPPHHSSSDSSAPSGQPTAPLSATSTSTPLVPLTPAPAPAVLPAATPTISAPDAATANTTSEHKDAPLATPALDARPKTPVLGLPFHEVPARDRSPSSSSVQRPAQLVDTTADLVPRTRSRRNSFSDGDHKAERPTGLVLPPRPAMGKSASSSDLKSGLASPIIPGGAIEILIAAIHAERPSTPAPLSIITFYAGTSHKAFEVHKHSLTSRVPFLKKLFEHEHMPTKEETTYEDLDEYAFALFVRWLYGGELHGPNDFHSFQHYLSLYVLSQRFHIEALSNTVMDLCRAYYRLHSMTAPAYRIEYIYAFTSTPNHMRNFLITTAAYRSLCDAPIAPGEHLSDSMKMIIGKGGDTAIDFAQALIKLSKNGIVDVRRGSNCTFHEHSDGKYCQAVGMEPYENV